VTSLPARRTCSGPSTAKRNAEGTAPSVTTAPSIWPSSIFNPCSSIFPAVWPAVLRACRSPETQRDHHPRLALVAEISDTTIWRWPGQDAIRPGRRARGSFPAFPDFEATDARALDLYAREWSGQPLALAEKDGLKAVLASSAASNARPSPTSPHDSDACLLTNELFGKGVAILASADGRCAQW
jgi:hypothetical protein